MAKTIEPSAALLRGIEEYNKIQLDSNWSSIRHFYTINEKFCLDNDIPPVVYNVVGSKGAPNKMNLMYCFACLFLNEKVFKTYLNTLSKDIQLVLEVLLWRPSITEKEASLIVGHDIFDIEKRSYGSYVDKKLHRAFNFFTVKQLTTYASAEEVWFSLSLPRAIQEVVRDYYTKPLDYTINPVEQPEKTDFTFEAESLIFQDLQKLTAYYLQDNLKFSGRGKPNIASARKMGKVLSFKEFYTENDLLTSLRAYLLASFLGNLELKKVANDPLNMMRFLLKQQYELHAFSLAEALLVDIKGFGYVNYDFKKIGGNILSVLRKFPLEQWLSVDNIRKYVEIHNIDLLPLSDYDLANKIYFDSEEATGYDRKYKEKNYISSAYYKELIAYPILNSTFFLFAAYGFLEIAYDEIDTEEFSVSYDSVFDGLKYVKLTKLGAHVLGLTPNYEFANAVSSSNLIFSDDSLIILADGDLTVNEILLKNFTERVSGNRFRVSYDTFLKDCKTRKDLKNKIEIFRQTVKHKLPANWESFLEELTFKAKAIETTPNVVVLKLPETDRHLHSLIAQDAALKALVAKAENFQIIVTKDNYAKLKSRLKDYGYLLD